MKGFIFCEFLAMVDAVFSEDVTIAILEDADVPSGGDYQPTGNYDYQEIISLVVALSAITGESVPALARHFGRYLFGRFSVIYPEYFESSTDALSFLEQVEQMIHKEVPNRYSEARPPQIRCKRDNFGGMEVTYQSHRCLAPVARGLIEGCLDHFETEHHVQMIEEKDGSALVYRFTLIPIALAA